MTEDQSQARLAVESQEYQRLAAKHRDYEVRLNELKRKGYLSPREEIERTNLKKYKLRLKDKMGAMARELRSS